MRTFRNNHKRSRYRNNDRNFKRNGDNPKFNSDFSEDLIFRRKSPGKNNHNAPKLIEKYNDLAREALSNGDKILSENYSQHADHFLRILQEQRMSKIESKKESNELITKKVSANNVPGSNNKRTEPEEKLPKDI